MGKSSGFSPINIESERQEFKSVEPKIPELALLALNLDVETENFAREGKKHSDLQSLCSSLTFII